VHHRRSRRAAIVPAEPEVVLPDLVYRTEEPVHGIVCGMSLTSEQKRINELCSKVIATSDPAEFAQAVCELSGALRAQLTYLKEMVYDAKQTIARLPPPPPRSSGAKPSVVKWSDAK
jgi:hypothetical protein